jgi:hypothetical protein
MGALADGIDAAADQCPPDNRGNRNGMRETANRSPMSKENASARSAWTPRMNICRDSFTDIRWHRQLRPAPTFAPNGKQAIVPVDIIQIQGDDFAGPQTQSSQHQ